MTDIASLSIRVETLELENANRKMQGLGNTAGWLEGVVKKAMAAFGAYKVGEYIKEATLLAARYETLGVVMNVVGNNAGYSAKQMAQFQQGLEKSGISMIESRNTLATMAQAHIDLSKSTDLARLAQDAAVIGQMNSSEAFQRMIYGIQSGQTEVLKTIGINVNFENSYKALGLTLGKNAKDLNETEKTQARVNAVMEKAPDIAKVYASAMETAGKQLYSMKRYTDDLNISFGDVFKPAFGVAIGALNQAFKDMKEWAKANKDEMDLLGGAIGGTTGQMINMAKAMAGLSTDVMPEANDGFTLLRRTVQGVGGIIAVVTDDITALRVALLDWAYVSMSSMENTLGSIIAVSKMIPASLFVGNKAEIMAGMGYAKTYLNVSSTMAKQQADQLSMKPLATENWLNGLDQVNNPKAWKDDIKAGGGGGTDTKADADRKKKEQEGWDALARSAAEYANTLRSARQEYEMMQNTWETESQAQDARDAAEYAKERADEKTDYLNAEGLAKAEKAADDLRNVHTKLFGDMGNDINQWSRNFGDAFVDACFTGKNAFSDLVTSMLKDLAKMAVYQNVSSPLAGWIKGLFPTAAPAAEGGYRDGSKPYLVGERGPEIFNPGRGGTITPNSAIGGGIVNHISVSVASNGQVDAKTASNQGNAAAKDLENMMTAWAIKQQRSGGIFAPA